MPPLLDEEESALDPYAILGVEISASEKDVRKAYRQLSLKYHPDRNPAPEAKAKFREISLAQEILIDVAKRQYVDTKLEGERKRKERNAGLDKKRKEMVDSLNAREEDAKKAKLEQVKRRQQEAEEEAIKDAGRRMLEEAQKRAAAAAAAPSSSTSRNPATNGHGNGHSPHNANDATSSSALGTDRQPPISPLDLTLLLQFSASSSLASSSSSAVSLKAAISRGYGPVSHVLMKDPPDAAGEGKEGKKKKPKGRKAVVEFEKGNWGGCWACWKDHADDAGSANGSDGLRTSGRSLAVGVKAKWAGGMTPAWVDWADRQAAAKAGSGRTSAQNGTGFQANNLEPMRSDKTAPSGSHADPSSFATAPDLGGASSSDLLAQQSSRNERRRQEDEFESMTLLRMRQLERDRLAE